MANLGLLNDKKTITSHIISTMAKIHKEINIQALRTEGYSNLATIYSILETTEAETNFIHFMYDMAEKEQDSKLLRLIYPIITSMTGWSFNPYMLVNP